MARKVYTFEFKVKGVVSFPIDMLRYDACFPVSETQARAIEHSIFVNDTGSDGLEVTLVHRDLCKTWHPTVERWKSFCWQVTDVRLAACYNV